MLRPHNLRKRMYEIVELSESGDSVSHAYDLFMMFTIIASLVPLTISTTPTWASVLDGITVNIFILDYIFRLCTSDFRLQCGIKSFFIYPLTPMALIDLFSILPSFSILNQAFRMLKILRLFRTFRVFRVFKIARYSRSVEIIVNVLRKQRDPLFTVCGLSGAYILISALVIFNVEPQTFDNFFEAIYWATVSLTTVGYGDIYPTSDIGRIITMISSVFGIAIVALPAGIITAGYMDEISTK